MEVADIIHEIEKLEPLDKKRIIAHLVHRRLQDNSALRTELAQRLENKDPENWIGVEELEKRWKKSSGG